MYKVELFKGASFELERFINSINKPLVQVICISTGEYLIIFKNDNNS